MTGTATRVVKRKDEVTSSAAFPAFDRHAGVGRGSRRAEHGLEAGLAGSQDSPD